MNETYREAADARDNWRILALALGAAVIVQGLALMYYHGRDRGEQRANGATVLRALCEHEVK